jgi:hypothetical protein
MPPTEATGADSRAKAIEAEAHSLIRPVVPEDKFVLIVSVSNAAAKAGEEAKLPYISVKSNIAKLSQLMSGQSSSYGADLFEIELTFDQSVADATVKLLQKKLTKHFEIEGKNRRLAVEKALLVAPPSAGPEAEKGKPEEKEAKESNKDMAAPSVSNEADLAKLQLERTKIEVEREKFESAKQKESLKKDLADQKLAYEKKIEGLEKTSKQGPESQPNAGVEEKPKTLIEHLKEFQLLTLAAILGLIGLLAASILSGSHKKGLSSISKAVEAVGEGLASSVSAAGGGSDTRDNDRIETSASDRAGPGPGGADLGHSGLSDMEGEKLKQFVLMVEEKIEVLTKDGNFLFFRYFIDMANSSVHHAAAILVSLRSEIAKLLVENISIEEMDKIREFLSEEGALKQAQAARQDAFQSFYAKIAADEFAGSPLLDLRNISWLTRLDSAKMVDLALALQPSDQAGFLSCLTPSRLAYMVQNSSDPDRKRALIEAIKSINEASVEDVAGLFERVEAKATELAGKRREELKKIIDPARFYAEIISALAPGDRDQLLKAIEKNEALLDSLKKFYIRFEEIRNVSDSIVRGLFSKRPAKELAILAFAAEDDIRALIIQSLPEALRDTANEELSSLVANEAEKASYYRKSIDMQAEVARYLLKLNKANLLEFKTTGNKPKLASAS